MRGRGLRLISVLLINNRLLLFGWLMLVGWLGEPSGMDEMLVVYPARISVEDSAEEEGRPTNPPSRVESVPSDDNSLFEVKHE